MNPARWRRLQPILDRALELSGDERELYLQEACSREPDLRADLDRILAGDAAEGGRVDKVRRDTEAETERARISDPVSDAHGRFLPGAMLSNRYRIVARLGRGGMGEVYRADDLKIGQAVALKFLPEGLDRDPHFLDRLLAEVRIARQVSHPNVCRVYDVGEAGGRHFLTMEYVDGEDLASLLRRIGRLPREKALDIARQIAAGLGAAHEAGIVHRDLKPANVMLDGRGRVRITDFGLAAAEAVVRGPEARAGTPAYMAPEQIEGKEVTARSDVYALGLLLYELFTGKRAFEAATMEELHRQHLESTPASPSSHVDNLDPAVERAILRCLEKDPAMRPQSALAVAAALPGGDPLAAALAAGETPSPELVAAAGPRGALSPRLAAALLASALALLLLTVILAGESSILGWVPVEKSADALIDDAREILRKLGYTEKPRDSAAGIATSGGTIFYVSRKDPSPNRWDYLKKGTGIVPMRLWYRQAPIDLVPTGPNGVVSWFWDPPREPGDAYIELDLEGRLHELEVEPLRVDPEESASKPMEWSVLFDLAGLDPSAFTRTRSLTRSPGHSDERTAWSGVLGGVPVRIEAAAYRGRAVYFEYVIPTDPYWTSKGGQDSADEMPSSGNFGLIFSVLMILFLFGGTAFLVVRNLRLGRGDRRGAFRFAGAVFVLRFGWWVLGGHHVAKFGSPDVFGPGELNLASAALARALLVAAVFWCFYMALEPETRRRWPRVLVAWNRLLAGRFRDPLVGRDLLIGTTAGVLWALLWNHLYILIPHALSLENPPAPLYYPAPTFVGPPFQTLLGGRFAFAGFLAAILTGLNVMMATAVFFLGCRLLVRRDWIAVVVVAAVSSVFGYPGSFTNFSWIGITANVLGSLVFVTVLFRFGLLAAIGCSSVIGICNAFPITPDVKAPHFGISLFGVLALAAIAIYGWATSIRGRAALAEEPARN